MRQVDQGESRATAVELAPFRARKKRSTWPIWVSCSIAAGCVLPQETDDISFAVDQPSQYELALDGGASDSAASVPARPGVAHLTGDNVQLREPEPLTIRGANVRGTPRDAGALPDSAFNAEDARVGSDGGAPEQNCALDSSAEAGCAQTLPVQGGDAASHADAGAVNRDSDVSESAVRG